LQYIFLGDSFRNSGWHENITTAKNKNLIGIKDGVAVLVKDYWLVAIFFFDIFLEFKKKSILSSYPEISI